MMKIYDIILQGSEATEKNAYDVASQFDFSECELCEDKASNSNYIDIVGSIDIYYNYAADYYFFSPNN